MMLASPLRPNIFDRLSDSATPFAVINNRLFTIDTGNHGCGVWHHQGEQYALREADTLNTYRDELFGQVQQQVEKYMSAVINLKLINKLKTVSSQKRNYFEMNAQDNVQKFFSNVFATFNRHEKDPDAVLPALDLESQTPQIDALTSLEDCCDDFLPQTGIVCIADRVYRLDTDEIDVDVGCLMLNNDVYALKPFLLRGERATSSSIADEYDRQLRSQLESVALDTGKKFADQIEALESVIITPPKERDGMIGYTKVNNAKYSVHLDIPNHLMKKDNKYYCFSKQGSDGLIPIRIGITLSMRKDEFSIEGEPRVLNMPVRHPFVWDTSRICFNGPERWAQMGVIFHPEQYTVDDPESIVQVSKVLYEGLRNLTSGYAFGNVVPVNDIRKFTPVALTIGDAHSFCDAHNIDRRLIYDNDK